MGGARLSRIMSCAQIPSYLARGCPGGPKLSERVGDKTTRTTTTAQYIRGSKRSRTTTEGIGVQTYLIALFALVHPGPFAGATCMAWSLQYGPTQKARWPYSTTLSWTGW